MTDDRSEMQANRAAGLAKRHERRLAHAQEREAADETPKWADLFGIAPDFDAKQFGIESANPEISGNARHAAIDALIEAGFVDPDDGTVPRWRDNEPVPVWTVPAQVVDVVIEAALPHLRAHQTPDAKTCEHDWQEYWDGPLGYSATDKCTRCSTYRPTPDTRPVVDREAAIEAVSARLHITTDQIMTGGSPRQLVADTTAVHEAVDAVLALLPTEAETKALAETATKLGVKLGRQQAADEIAAKCLRRAQLAERVPEGERSGVREGMVVTWLAAEKLAREAADG